LSRILICAAIAANLAFWPTVSSAQELPIKRALPMVSGTGCVPLPPPVPPTLADQQEAATLASSAAQATVLGDQRTARELLSRAARLDPTAEHIAYLLARTLEELGDASGAVAEYCRYLQLAPNAAGTDEVRATVERLTAGQRLAVPESAATAFQAGVAAFDERRLADAEAAFDEAIAQSGGTWADAHYNRGVVRLARGDEDDALLDLARYLELAPDASDRELILTLALRLRPMARGPDPTVAFFSGLIPGVGHFYSGRPLMGALLLGAAGGALAIAFGIQEQRIECLARVTPGTGGCPNNQIRGDPVVSRPYLVAGLGAAATITLLGAIDAARGASGGPAALAIPVGEVGGAELRFHFGY